ncbi:MAG TPA: M14 family zinc carboxypeptidase [Armatimonadota bacterium]|jgi:protein MpaA
MNDPFSLGRSVLGAEILCYRLGEGPETTLFLGSHHGNEPHGPVMVRRLMELLDGDASLLADRAAVFVPTLNPDGLSANTRRNARGVDLNRNLPTRDWQPYAGEDDYAPGPAPASEPETRALVALVESVAPIKIVTIHAPLHCVNWNGLSRDEAALLPSAGLRRVLWEGRPAVCVEELGAAMAERNGYPLLSDVGYPCPGSFGTWAGFERRIATITLEVGRDCTPEAAWTENRDALLAALDY